MGAIRKYADQSLPDVTSGTVSITDNAAHDVIAAQGSRQLMMDSLSVANSSASNVTVDILSGATVIWTVSAPATGGSNMPFPKPIPANAGDALRAQVSSGVNAVKVSIGAHILPPPVST